jgi:hypothetical protein
VKGFTRASADRPLYLKNVVWQAPCPYRNHKRVSAELTRPCLEVFLERRALSILGLCRGKRDHVSRAGFISGFPPTLTLYRNSSGNAQTTLVIHSWLDTIGWYIPQACSSAVLPESLEPRGLVWVGLARSRTQEPAQIQSIG